MRFLLDTEICAYAMKGRPRVLENLASHRRSELAISVISEAELRYGAAHSDEPPRMTKAVERFLLSIEVLDFTSTDAEVYGEIRARLRRAGTPIGDLDLLIAAQARAHKLVLVTNNEREFRRVPGLTVDNWAR